MTSYNCNCDDGFEHETLLSIRKRVARIGLNMSAQANNLAPGVAEYIDDAVRFAQEMIYMENPEVFQTMRYFTWNCVQGERFYDLNQNAEYLQLPTPTGIALNQLNVGSINVGTYGYRVAAVNANGITLASATVQITTVGASRRVEVSWDAVAGATAYYIYGRTPGSELYIGAVNGNVFSFIDDGSLTPAGALPTANTTAECRKLLNENKIEAVFISDSPGRWRKLRNGIDPSWLDEPVIESIPTHYEIRQCIELYPAPQAGIRLMVKGGFHLLPLDVDTDTVTIDKNLVFARAVANVKASRGHPDAGNYVAQGDKHMQNIVANMHHGNRYIPSGDRSMMVDNLSGVDYGQGVLYDNNGNILRDNS